MASALALVAAVVVAVVHLAFLGYIVLGGFLALRRLAWLWPSIATTLYSAYVTLAGFTCPLTTLEKWLLEVGGKAPYEGSFIAHYLHDVLYPAQYERAAWLVAMGIALVSYALVLTRWRRRQPVLQPAISAHAVKGPSMLNPRACRSTAQRAEESSVEGPRSG